MSTKGIPVIAIETDIEIVLSGLAMNLMFYALLSFVVVKAFFKIKEEIYYYRYNKQ